MSKSKLTLSFVFNSISYYVNQSQTYFAKKADTDTRITRISRANYEAAKAALDAELASIPTPAPVDPVISAPVEAAPATPAPIEAAPAPVDPTPATVATVDATAEAVPATVRPDWEAQATFERVTFEDLQSIPATVARGLGIATMATLKFAAMGMGMIMGLALMGLKKAVAR